LKITKNSLLATLGRRRPCSSGSRPRNAQDNKDKGRPKKEKGKGGEMLKERLDKMDEEAQAHG